MQVLGRTGEGLHNGGNGDCIMGTCANRRGEYLWLQKMGNTTPFPQHNNYWVKEENLDPFEKYPSLASDLGGRTFLKKGHTIGIFHLIKSDLLLNSDVTCQQMDYKHILQLIWITEISLSWSYLWALGQIRIGSSYCYLKMFLSGYQFIPKNRHLICICSADIHNLCTDVCFKVKI